MTTVILLFSGIGIMSENFLKFQKLSELELYEKIDAVDVINQALKTGYACKKVHNSHCHS